jgi:hypothetical protein
MLEIQDSDFVGGWWCSAGEDLWIEIREPRPTEEDESVAYLVVFHLGREEIHRENVFGDEFLTAVDCLLGELENEHESLSSHIENVGFSKWEIQIDDLMSELQGVIYDDF